ncbi:MAG: hypothetical protein U5L45_03720 [Saprospiraceae bacterium]|nr:hypothetical protein [Saprospiraceae bacterium]
MKSSVWILCMVSKLLSHALASLARGRRCGSFFGQSPKNELLSPFLRAKRAID